MKKILLSILLLSLFVPVISMATEEEVEVIPAVNIYYLIPQTVYSYATVWTGIWKGWVNIGWLTSQFSTSRVVYGRYSVSFPINENHYPVSQTPWLNPMEGTDYGYQYSTVQDDFQATWHTMWLSGLRAGTYYYRTISREPNRTEFVSREFSFTVPQE